MITTPSQQTRPPTAIPLLAICLGYFMTILDVTIVNVALVNINEQLSANVTGLQWIVDGYALVFASLLLTGGALGDRRGSRTIFLVGLPSSRWRQRCVALLHRLHREDEALICRLGRRACPGLTGNDRGGDFACTTSPIRDSIGHAECEQASGWCHRGCDPGNACGQSADVPPGHASHLRDRRRTPHTRVGSCMGLHVRTQQETAQM